jgi:hypothetical protein
MKRCGRENNGGTAIIYEKLSEYGTENIDGLANKK